MRLPVSRPPSRRELLRRLEAVERQLAERTPDPLPGQQEIPIPDQPPPGDDHA